ncbi:MAG: ATPase [Bacteroidetes bacterium]|nr:MAG: ATPase [Bacteroidota bacterium]
MDRDFNVLYRIAFLICLLGIVGLITDFGYDQTNLLQSGLIGFYFFVLVVGIGTTVLRYLTRRKLIRAKVVVFDAVTILFSVWVMIYHLFLYETSSELPFLHNDNWVKFAVVLTFIREFSELRLNFNRTILNPAQLFILSFLVMILLGAFLLALPNATQTGISSLDALFTSTSAVCVTGLIVVDTGSFFTDFGQIVILGLIQIGGLGILTFASYFSYFFKGGTTYENQLVLSDMTSNQKIGEVFSTLKYVLLITFAIELIAAVLLFVSLEGQHFDSLSERGFFAIFHAVSAFCNAGFSTLPNGLYEEGFRYNYFMQLVIIATFGLGGLGFPILVNLANYLKYRVTKAFSPATARAIYRPWVLNINSRITLITTFSLTIIGFALFYVLEYHHTLAAHEGFGKVVTALFGATTPRTAGFNTVDMTALQFPTLMIILFLMWVGASPASTGGGIKTSTFALAMLNILSLAKGKSRIELYRREIADLSVRRAFAVIALSLFVIGLGIMLISVFDSDKDLMSIAFECFSAYSTVGLSIGLTASLSSAGKFILILIMFIGRVSMLSIMIAVVKKIKHKNYRYPTEEITIN